MATLDMTPRPKLHYRLESDPDPMPDTMKLFVTRFLSRRTPAMLTKKTTRLVFYTQCPNERTTASKRPSHSDIPQQSTTQFTHLLSLRQLVRPTKPARPHTSLLCSHNLTVQAHYLPVPFNFLSTSRLNTQTPKLHWNR